MNEEVKIPASLRTTLGSQRAEAQQNHNPRIRHEGPERNDHESAMMKQTQRDANPAVPPAEKPGHVMEASLSIQHAENMLADHVSRLRFNLSRILGHEPEKLEGGALDNFYPDGYDPTGTFHDLHHGINRINRKIAELSEQVTRLESL